MVLMQTGTTCGAVCWYAKEQDCRCSCGGRSHGVMATDDAEGIPPRRNCMIQGTRYVLAAVVMTSGWRYERDFALGYAKEHREVDGRYLPRMNARGAVLQSKLASASQCERWPEVVAFLESERRRLEEQPGGFRFRIGRPHLVWVRDDAAPDFDAWQAAGEPRR